MIWNFRFRAARAMTLAALLASCGTPVGGGGFGSGNFNVDGGTSGGNGGWASQKAAAYCSAIARCSTQGLPHFAKFSNCMAWVEPWLNLPPNSAASIAAGTLTFDAAAAAACVSQVQTLSCDVVADLQDYDPCPGVVTGTKPDGAGCTTHRDCQSNNCATDQTRGCFICQQPLPPGLGCPDDETCAAGSSCIDFQCRKLGKLVEGEPCTEAAQCQLGLRCAQVGSARACTPPLPSGANCADIDACSTGEVCDYDEGQGEHLCRPAAGLEHRSTTCHRSS